MRKLTQTAKRTYITSTYGRCPYCQSENIVGHSVEIDGNGANQYVSCECGRSWYDIYRLVDIEETE